MVVQVIREKCIKFSKIPDFDEKVCGYVSSSCLVATVCVTALLMVHRLTQISEKELCIIRKETQALLLLLCENVFLFKM